MSEGREGKAELATAIQPALIDCLSADASPTDKMDAIQAMMACSQERIDAPLVHRFTPGLYVREIYMPKGCVIISKIHKTEHPYTVSRGAALVWTGNEVVTIRAPHTGITKPGTRRVLFILEDCIWSTYHVTNETDLDKIEDQLIESHPIPAELMAQARKAIAAQSAVAIGA